MVWFQRGRFGPKRKWGKDRYPHPDYWTGGFFANFEKPLEKTERIVYEINPVKDRSTEIGISTYPRSLEIWKEKDTNEIMVAASADPNDKAHPQALGHETTQLDTSIPEWCYNEDIVGFDIELNIQNNFSKLQGNIPHILNLFAAEISQYESSSACIQVVWQDISGVLSPILGTAIEKINERDEKVGLDDYHKELLWGYSSRQGERMIGVSIRGMLSSPDIGALFASLTGVVSKVGIVNDHLEAWNYHGPAMIEWLETRTLYSQAAIDILEDNAKKMWDKGRWGLERDLAALLITNVYEAVNLIQVPDDPKLPLKQMRQKRGGATPVRTGFALDSTEYGEITESAASISPEHLPMHTYVLGATGSGKSSLLRTMIKHLEIANEQGTHESATIFIDVKGHDGVDCYRQCKKDTDVKYIDINDENFALNLLELPSYSTKDRDVTISRTVGQIIGTIKEVYAQQQTFVQLERVMRLLLHFLYANTDKPTMLDLFALILELQSKSESTIKRILQIYNKVSVPEMQEAIMALNNMPRDSWTSLINRIEPFVIEKHLRNKFGTELTTVNFDEMLEPGKITIIRIAEAETPAHVHKMISMIVVMRIWAAILARKEKDPTPVMLFLDEFHTMAGMETIKTMLSRARSFGLGLVLAHQNLQQIPENLVDTIVGNTATQLYGRISGTSAAKIARIVEPTDASALTERLNSQPNYVFTLASMPSQGAEREEPFAITAAPPPGIIREMPPALEAPKHVQSEAIERKLVSSTIDWTHHAMGYIPTRDEWNFMVALRSGTKSQKEACIDGKLSHTDVGRDVIKSLKDRGLVETDRDPGRGRAVMCTLTMAAKGKFFSGLWGGIGTAKDTSVIAATAFEHYIEKGMFVTMAKQGERGAGEKNTDLVAYDYDTALPISVEIESTVEVKSHPEHVVFNMTKWPDMGFAMCDVWSTSEMVIELRKRADPSIADRVTCHIVDDEGNVTRVSEPGEE